MEKICKQHITKVISLSDDVAKGLVHLPKRAITAEVDLRRDGVKSDAVLDVSQQSSVCFSVTGGQQYNENRVNLCGECLLYSNSLQDHETVTTRGHYGDCCL